MIRINNPTQGTMPRSWFSPEIPGSLVAAHVVNTGNGTCLVDQWPWPQAAIFESYGNVIIYGEAAALDRLALKQQLRGFVEAAADVALLLENLFPDFAIWSRVTFVQRVGQAPFPPVTTEVRRLQAEDAALLSQLSAELLWISKTWGGPTGLAESGGAWGAFVADRLAAVACPFFCGDTYEEIGVVTEQAFRNRGLSTACASALIGDIHARDHVPVWTTAPENAASIRVAEKLGFTAERGFGLYAIGIDLPD